MQHAVDAIAHLQMILERLDVHVRRALLDRALQDQVDQPDHRRFGRQIAQMLDVVFFGGAAVEVLHDGAHRRTAGAVITFDQAVDFRTQPDPQRDRPTSSQRTACSGYGSAGSDTIRASPSPSAPARRAAA
jgi:hypothetical protein